MKTDISTILKQITDLKRRVSVLERQIVNQPEQIINSVKELSLKEFLLEKRPKNDVQKTFYIGVYLEKYKGIGSFTMDDIKKAFKVAKEPSPLNINDKINKNISKGRFMESDTRDGKKTWMLTSTGEQAANSDTEIK
ncbi:MAG: hypothetical protein QY322_02180 [bacterium]|nr:MAG: hypothetical protein QY322_02180 [bacterium]